MRRTKLELELQLLFEFHTPSMLTIHSNRTIALHKGKATSSAHFEIIPKLAEALKQIEDVKLDSNTSSVLKYSLTTEIVPTIDMEQLVMRITLAFMEYFGTHEDKTIIEEVICHSTPSEELIYR